MQNTNELWSFDFSQQKWDNIKSQNEPQQIDSHIALLYMEQIPEQAQMIVATGFLGGESATYSNQVVSYNFSKNSWTVIFLGVNSGFAPK